VTASARSTKEIFSAAESWLLNSGIHDAGVHAWYDTKSQELSFLYPEITGYYLTSLLYLDSRSSRPEYLSHAIIAGDWLLDTAVDPSNGAVRCRFDGETWLPRQCAFDNGMCITGLTHLYNKTEEKKYLDGAIRMAQWLLTVMRQSDGSYFAKFNVKDKKPENPGGKWSLISGAYLGKLSIGFSALAKATNDPQYEQAVRALNAWSLTQQQEDGRFMTDEDSAKTFVHPHCYAAEGLLVSGLTFGEQKWIDAARKAVEWIAPHQLSSGGFAAYYEDGKFLEIESPDISAQVLRLWWLLPEREGISIDADGLVKSIASFQSSSDKQEEAGGIASGPAWFVGTEDRSGQHINSWVTMFCLQTLGLVLDEGEMEALLLV